MSTEDIIWIVIGLGLIVGVWFAQNAGFSAGSYMKHRQRKRDDEEQQNERRGYFRGKR